MSLAEAFEGLRAQEPGRPGTQAPKRSGNEGRKSAVEGGTRKNQSNGSGEPARSSLPLQGTAKSKHPDFEAVKVYLRRNTHKLARRKCEDQEGGCDFSDLVERLLEQYIGGPR